MTDPLGFVNGSAGAHLNPQVRQAQQNAPAEGPQFMDLLMENIEQVNELQQEAEAAIADLAAGRRDDVAAVMIAKEKADLAFKMLLQVRNKMLSAYQEIEQLRI